MEKEDIVDYLKEYENFKPALMERELSVPLDSSFVISIIGQRRAGKTYYLFQLSREMSDYISVSYTHLTLPTIYSV